MNRNELEAMSTAEKLQAIELLWGALSVSEVTIESPAWHEEVILARKSKIETGEVNFISLNKLREHYKK